MKKVLFIMCGVFTLAIGSHSIARPSALRNQRPIDVSAPSVPAVKEVKKRENRVFDVQRIGIIQPDIKKDKKAREKAKKKRQREREAKKKKKRNLFDDILKLTQQKPKKKKPKPDNVGRNRGNREKGFGEGKGSGTIKDPYILPICYHVPEGFSEKAVNSMIKGIYNDHHNACKVTIVPYVFRTVDWPGSPGGINGLGSKGCNHAHLNKVLGINTKRRLVHSFPNSITMADRMCKSWKIPGLVPTTSVAGCAGGDVAIMDYEGRNKNVVQHEEGHNHGGEHTKDIIARNHVPIVWGYGIARDSGIPRSSNDFLPEKLPFPFERTYMANFSGAPNRANATHQMPKYMAHDPNSRGGPSLWTGAGCAAVIASSTPNDGTIMYNPKRRHFYNSNMDARSFFKDTVGNKSFFFPTGEPPSGGGGGNRGLVRGDGVDDESPMKKKLKTDHDLAKRKDGWKEDRPKRGDAGKGKPEEEPNKIAKNTKAKGGEAKGESDLAFIEGDIDKVFQGALSPTGNFFNESDLVFKEDINLGNLGGGRGLKQTSAARINLSGGDGFSFRQGMLLGEEGEERPTVGEEGTEEQLSDEGEKDWDGLVRILEGEGEDEDQRFPWADDDLLTKREPAAIRRPGWGLRPRKSGLRPLPAAVY